MKKDMFYGLNDQNKKLNKKKVIKITIIALIICLIVVLGTLYEKNNKIRDIMDKYVFMKEKYEDNSPSIFVDLDSGLKAYAYKGNILILKNNLLTVYNRNGNEEYTLDIKISNPIFVSNGNYLCVAEENGQKLYVISDKNIIWQKDLEGNISDLVINSNGYLAVSLSGTTYKTIIQIFDNTGTELFTRFISFAYAIDMDISPDNKYLAIAEINCSGILIQSSIKIISIDKAKNGDTDSIVNTYSNKEGDLLVNLKYQGKDELTCIYDNHIETIKDGANSVVSDFSKQETLFADLNDRIIEIIKKDSQVYLQIVNGYSNNAKEYEIREPKEIHVSDNIIAINLGSEVLFYNNSGWLVKKYHAKQEINKIVLCDDLAGIVYNDKIELVSL